MADKDQRLVLAILDFLQDSIKKGKVKEDDREGIEVAVQCIGEAFGVDPSDEAQRNKLTLSPNSLESIFDVYLKTRDKLSVSAPTSTTSSSSAATSSGPSAADKSAAETHKQRGNTLMSSKSFQQAVDAYSEAIRLDGTNPVYYSNRAAAYSSMEEHDKAIEDANKALELDPAFVRAYSRLGHAQYSTGDFEGAVKSFSKGLELDPTNANLKTGLENSRKRVSAASSAPSTRSAPGAGAGLGGADAGEAGGFPDLASLAGMMGGGGSGGAGRGGGMPDLSTLMQNPMLMQMAQSMMANGGLERMMQNPSVRNMAERMQAGGGMPSMADIMNDPSLRDMANQFMGGGRGAGGSPPGSV
jgi:small glutamine-rich tetratricopeptide repeat-containing protein alpha